MRKEIPIFFTFDNDYVVPAAVAFHSLLQKASADDSVFYKMYVLHSDITVANQALLLGIVCRHTNGTLVFVDTQGFLKDQWETGNFDINNKNPAKQFTSDALIRCFGARFFPQYKKIIYSDVDIVFTDDISELFDIDLNGKYIGAIKNPFMKFDPQELSHLSEENYKKFKDTYFGGGIWVMNLEKIRDDNLEEKMLEIIKDDTIVKRWNDQDVMNLACDNKVEYISLRYCSYPYMPDRLAMKNFTSHYSHEELIESIEKPKIVHYAAWKPWGVGAKKAEIWWDIFDELELPRTRIFKTTPAPPPPRPYDELSFKAKIAYNIWKYLDKKLKERGIVN